jgi:hypothetical protein
MFTAVVSQKYLLWNYENTDERLDSIAESLLY